MNKSDKQYLKDYFYIYRLQKAQEVVEREDKSMVRWNKKRIKKNIQKLKASSEVVKNGWDRPQRESKAWRAKVLMRHLQECQICGGADRLEAHHIESYADNEHLRWDVDNGACLCKRCHKKFHDYFGRGGNTEKQWIVFYSWEKL